MSTIFFRETASQTMRILSWRSSRKIVQNLSRVTTQGPTKIADNFIIIGLRCFLSLSLLTMAEISIIDTADAEVLLKNGSLHLTFDGSLGVDQSTLSKRDISKPFVFYLNSKMQDIGNRFPFIASKGTSFSVDVIDSPPESNNILHKRALKLSIESIVEANVQDKIMFSPVPHQSDAALILNESGDGKEFSFDFKLSKDFENPYQWELIMQAWQCCGGSPPFSINVLPNDRKDGDITLVFLTRDDKDEANMEHRGNEIYRKTVSRDTWNNVSLCMRPSVDSNSKPGSIVIRWNNEIVKAWRGHFGYDLIQGHSNNYQVTKYIGFDLGLYRRRQTGNQTIYIDNIKYISCLSDSDD